MARGNYAGAVPGIVNAGREVGNAISPGMGNRFGNIASTVGGMAGMINGNQRTGAPAQAQLLNFLNSTPFLQSLLSSIATGNLGTGLQMLKEDGSATNTSYVEMLESLKFLTENAIAEADNAGAYGNLTFESESDRDGYIEALIEDIGNYENTLLPNYDTVTY
jgi:ABC-type glycerol-3-phosphate transport system substrate-binding protein